MAIAYTYKLKTHITHLSLHVCVFMCVYVCYGQTISTFAFCQFIAHTQSNNNFFTTDRNKLNGKRIILQYCMASN